MIKNVENEPQTISIKMATNVAIPSGTLRVNNLQNHASCFKNDKYQKLIKVSIYENIRKGRVEHDEI